MEILSAEAAKCDNRWEKTVIGKELIMKYCENVSERQKV